MKALKPSRLSQAILGVLLASMPVMVIAETKDDNKQIKKKVEEAGKDAKAVVLDDVRVESVNKVEKFPDTAKSTPSYKVNAVQVDQYTNATTVEDYVKFAPGLQVRRRYIGDPNPVLGMRGSSSFQTGHTSVYADGMPLHNPLQVSFSGAPRWSMVSPNELDTAEVLYGPFSAQHAGAFGGVVNLRTKMPEKFQAHFDAMGMFQDLHYGGLNQTLEGYKTNVSAGNRYDKFSVFASYNKLENQGQPQSPVTVKSSTTSLSGAIPVTGGMAEEWPVASAVGGSLPPSMLIGANGIEKSTTDLFKVKMGYDFTPDLEGRFTIAYEERLRDATNPYSLLKNASGVTQWGGGTLAGGSTTGNYVQDGRFFAGSGSTLAPSFAQRQALNYGLNLKGKISKDWSIDTTASYYDQFKDKSVSASLNPNHPNYLNKGQVTDVAAWWASYDLKLSTDNFLNNKDLSFMGGYQFNHASLNIDVLNSNNYGIGTRDTFVSDSGGQTQMNSGFSQIEWRFMPDWSLMAGARYDDWQTIGGHVRTATSNQNYSDRDAGRISPKASLEFSPDQWTFRYSFSKAYRFPFAQELYASNSSFNATTVAYPGLGPENGYFHNFMTQYDLPKGFVRANFFYQTINDEILSTTAWYGTRSLTTYQPIEQTSTIGTDLTFQQNRILGTPIDFMVNGTFLNKEVTKNSRNSSYVGNEWIRIPKLQVNTAVTYHVLPQWDASVSTRYRSDLFNDLENLEQGSKVLGSTTEYTFVDLKTSYMLPSFKKLQSTISGGIDNVFDQKAYEYHPFPQRTYYVKLSLDY